MPWIITALITSYLLGSVPTAYIFVKLLKGADIRTLGSGNVGATNASRVLGKPLGIVILLLDAFKGFTAVFFIGSLLLAKTPAFGEEMSRLLLGIATILGHSWTVFLNFKGGKGVASTLGVLIGLSSAVPGLRIIIGLAFLTWVIVFVFTRIVSLSSVIASASFPVYMVVFKQPIPLIAATSVIAFFIIFRHKSNLQRLLQGKEKRLS